MWVNVECWRRRRYIYNTFVSVYTFDVQFYFSRRKLGKGDRNKTDVERAHAQTNIIRQNPSKEKEGCANKTKATKKKKETRKILLYIALTQYPLPCLHRNKQQQKTTTKKRCEIFAFAFVCECRVCFVYTCEIVPYTS